MRKNRLFNIIIFLCAASACKAGSFYVSPSGNGNGTLSAPFKTIQQAADIAKAGDTIFIAGGCYSEMNICFKHSGNETDGYIVCCAQPGSGKVVLSQTDNTDADNNVAFMDISNKSHIWIEGIEFSNVTCLKACITMTNASQCVITGNRFIHLGNHIEYFNLSGQRLHRISGLGLVIKKIYYHNNSVKTTKTIIR